MLISSFEMDATFNILQHELPLLTCSEEECLADFVIRKKTRLKYPGACSLERIDLTMEYCLGCLMDSINACWKGCLMQQIVDTKLTPKNQIIVINCILFRNSLMPFRNSIQLHEK
jgi:hypothetical protein